MVNKIKISKRYLQDSSAIDYVWYLFLIMIVLIIFAFSSFQLDAKYLANTTKNNLYFCADCTISLNQTEDHTFNRKDIIVNYDTNSLHLSTTTDEKNELTQILSKINETFVKFFYLDEATHIPTTGIYKLMCGNNRIDLTEVVIYQPIYSVVITPEYDSEGHIKKENGIPVIRRKYEFEKVRIYRCPFVDGTYTVPTTSEVKLKSELGSSFEGARLDITMGLTFYGVKKIFSDASESTVFEENPTNFQYQYILTQTLDIVPANNDKRMNYGTD